MVSFKEDMGGIAYMKWRTVLSAKICRGRYGHVA